MTLSVKPPRSVARPAKPTQARISGHETILRLPSSMRLSAQVSLVSAAITKPRGEVMVPEPGFEPG
jgi:hypothetical protein